MRLLGDKAGVIGPGCHGHRRRSRGRRPGGGGVWLCSLAFVPDAVTLRVVSASMPFDRHLDDSAARNRLRGDQHEVQDQLDLVSSGGGRRVAFHTSLILSSPMRPRARRLRHRLCRSRRRRSRLRRRPSGRIAGRAEATAVDFLMRSIAKAAHVLVFFGFQHFETVGDGGRPG